MARKIQHRRGNQEQNDLFTGAPGEITFDSDLKTLRIHDGETTGGTKLLNETLASQKYTKIDLSNVSTTGTTSSQFDGAGGLIGTLVMDTNYFGIGVEINDSYNTGEITSTKNAGGIIGGGNIGTTVKINNCYKNF